MSDKAKPDFSTAIAAMLKEGRWKWLRTLRRNELGAIELSEEEREVFLPSQPSKDE